VLRVFWGIDNREEGDSTRRQKEASSKGTPSRSARHRRKSVDKELLSGHGEKI